MVSLILGCNSRSVGTFGGVGGMGAGLAGFTRFTANGGLQKGKLNELNKLWAMLGVL